MADDIELEQQEIWCSPQQLAEHFQKLGLPPSVSAIDVLSSYAAGKTLAFDRLRRQIGAIPLK